jgi:hypothetical protein
MLVVDEQRSGGGEAFLDVVYQDYREAFHRAWLESVLKEGRWGG